MKTTLLLVVIGLSIAGTNASAADARSARVAKAYNDLDKAMSVQVVKIVFPTYSPHDLGTVYEHVDLADNFDLVISLTETQKVLNILASISSERAIKCDPSASKGYGVLRVEYKDHRVDDYLVSENFLQSRSTGKCFRQSPWIQQAYALWNSNS